MKLADAYTLLISIFICKKSCYYFSIDLFYWLIQIFGKLNNLNTYQRQKEQYRSVTDDTKIQIPD